MTFFSKYRDGLLSHDKLAEKSAQAYAKYLSGLSVKKVNQDANEFVKQDRHKLFSYTAEVFDLIKDFNIQPIIISGCPEIILNQYKSIFNLNDVLGLNIGHKNGSYVEHIESNPGINTEKRNVITKFYLSSNEIDMAFGNSLSDMPLFESSKINVVVNNHVLQVPGHKIAASEDSNFIASLKSLIIKIFSNE